MNKSNCTCSEEIEKDGMAVRPGTLLPQHEYVLAAATTIIALIAVLGSLQMIWKLVKKRRKCGIQFVIYMSILAGNALMAFTTMPMSTYIILVYRVPLSQNQTVFSESSPSSTTPIETVLCNISGYVYNVTRSTTLWSVCFFTLDRVLFVCFPFKAQRRVKYWHYSLVIGIIWAYFISMSVSPFLFGKIYRRFDFEGLTCTFIIQDIIPNSLTTIGEDGAPLLPMNILIAYTLLLSYIPHLLPLILITCFTIAVVIELLKMNKKGSKYQTSIARLGPKKEENNIGWYEKLLTYLDKNKEVKLSVIMLLTTIGFLICYSLWIFFYIFHLGIGLKLVERCTLYVSNKEQNNPEQGNLYSKLYQIHEMVGFAHAAIEPMILYLIMVRPKPTTSARSNSYVMPNSPHSYNYYSRNKMQDLSV